MYAVIKTGGKQYKVAVGDKLKVEKLAAAEGASVALPRVLLADGGDFTFGAPAAAAESAVSATVLSHGRGEKIRVFKMKRRKNYRRTQGHRQPYTEIEITAIGDAKTAGKTETKTGKVTKKVAKKTAKKIAAKGKTAKKTSGKSAGVKTKPEPKPADSAT